jgi:carbohydrate-selective porin OprB
LAAIGIKPLVLLISDPFGNVTGGRRRGFTEYDLLGIDVIVDTEKLLGWPGGERTRIEAALAQTKGKISGRHGAAAKLGIPASTLESKIRSLRINKFQFKGG